MLHVHHRISGIRRMSTCYMYENKVHSVPDRIVSISQPYIRPIVRGKAAAPVEFGEQSLTSALTKKEWYESNACRLTHTMNQMY